MELIALDDALEALSLLDPIQSKVVELRFFGGLSVAETAWWGGTGRRLGFGCCARCGAKHKWPNSSMNHAVGREWVDCHDFLYFRHHRRANDESISGGGFDLCAQQWKQVRDILDGALALPHRRTA